jgi:hypothetical protein
MQTGALYNFAKDATTNSLKYSGPGGKFHIVATFNFTTNSQNVCGFYVGHNTDDATALDADADRISESEIYINASTTANQPVGGAIQTVLDLQPDDRVYFIVQNRDAANNITVQFLKFTATSLTAEKGDGILPGGNTGDLLIKASGSDYDTAWTAAPTVDKLGLDTTAAEAVTTGQIAWDAPNATPVVRHRPNVIGRLGQDTHCLCKNTSAVSLIKGRVVMFTGADSVSGRVEIGPLLADGTYPGYVYFGVTAEAIAIDGFGMVCTFGFIEGIDTSIYPEDSILWACTVNPGAMVLEENLQPAPALSIPTAVVVKSDATDGVIFVRANTGSELRLLHDVYTDLAADGDVLTWIDNLNRWESKAPVNDAPRSITIAEPQIGDSFTLFRTTRATTITSAVALVSSGSVTYELRYAADRTTAGTLATASDTVTNTTTGDSATVQNQPIPVDRYVWVEITAVSGTVNEFNLSVAF